MKVIYNIWLIDKTDSANKSGLVCVRTSRKLNVIFRMKSVFNLFARSADSEQFSFSIFYEFCLSFREDAFND